MIDVIKYNGDANILAWKHPNEELSTYSELIVNESQEAILVKEGQICDIFGAGRYTLDTENIPILNKLIHLPYGGHSPFTVEVWYINKAYNLDVKWGTPTPIQIQDPKYGIFIPVRSNGAFGVHIEDSAVFLKKLVGTLNVFDITTLRKYFRSLQVTKVKDTLSAYFINRQISILEINAYIDELSEYMKERIASVMTAYGVALDSFYVNEISTPEDDPSVKHLKEVLSKRAEMNIIGMNISVQNMHSKFRCCECGFPISRTAKFCSECGQKINPCSNCGIDLPEGTKICPECGQKLDVFCPSCGTKIVGTPTFCMECGQKL